jgi:hypothetical protein
MGEIMSKYWEKYGMERCEGFDIVFSVAPEDIHPADCFDDSIDLETGTPYHDIPEMIRRIDNGTLSWFVARVEAYKNGVLLASEYLGGNLYEEPTDFISDSGYYEDMKDTAINEAKETIKKLTEDITK